jgi:predicted GIY-YIG superfamily endonuclease
MIYSIPKSIVVSYLGGCFGNSLVAMILASKTKKKFKPYENTFHVVSWPNDSTECTITRDSTMKFLKNFKSTDIIQVHCLNADILDYKFPISKRILLTCTNDDEYFGIQRQWLVLTDQTMSQNNLILSAWDWIDYNCSKLNENMRMLKSNNKNTLCFDFKTVLKNTDKLELLLGFKITNDAKNMYQEHYQRQIEKFYIVNENFKLAWDVYHQQGSTAPIEDIIMKGTQ